MKKNTESNHTSSLVSYGTSSLVIGSLTLLLLGCSGPSSDPLAKYAGLKSADPTDTKVETQTIAEPDLFELQIEGTNALNNGQYTEGQFSETLIRVKSKSSKILRYSIELSDFSSTERPTLTVTNEPNVYSLRWSPPVGTIPMGEWGKAFQARFQIIVLEAQNKSLENLTNSKTLEVMVSRNNAQPKIAVGTELKNGVEEFQKTEFSVDVEDSAGLHSPRAPEIQVTPYIFSNTEAYRADGSHYVILNDKKQVNPEKLSDNRFRFFYVFDVNNLPLDRDRSGNEVPNATSVDVCFQMRAVSAVGTLSAQTQVCTKARYAAQPPVITFPDMEIRSSVENIINLQISSAHALSQISIKNPSQQLANLSGQKEILCNTVSATQKNQVSCTIKWTPSCVKENVVKTLTLKAESKLGSGVKSTSISKEYRILANPEGCMPSTTRR